MLAPLTACIGRVPFPKCHTTVAIVTLRDAQMQCRLPLFSAGIRYLSEGKSSLYRAAVNRSLTRDGKAIYLLIR